MKTRSKTPHTLSTITLCILLMLVPTVTAAQIFDEDYTDTSALNAEAQLALRSDYVFRGENLYNGTSFQPRAKISINTEVGTLYFRVSSHISADQGGTKQGAPFETTDPDADSDSEDTTDSDDTSDTSDSSDETDSSTIEVARLSPSFDEFDFDVGYQTSVGITSIDVGNRWYMFSKTTERLLDTREVYGELGFETVLHPRFLAAFDWDKRDGWYFETGVGQPFPFMVMDQTAYVTPNATVGLNSSLNKGDHPIYADSGVVFYDFGLKSSVPLSESISLEPEVHYTEGEDHALGSELWFGVSLNGELGF